MRKLSDPRFAFMHDADLYDLVGRLILKRVRDEAFAEDIRNGAYEVAMKLVCREKGPVPATERGWMCCVARNHTYAELRRRKDKQEPTLDKDDAPDLPVADQQTLYEEQLVFEKLLDAVAQAAADNPEQAALLLDADGRTKQGAEAGPKDAAARKGKQRAKTSLASAVSALVAAAIVFLWFRAVPPPVPGLRPGSYATLADASHDLAHRSCADHAWVSCLENLGQMRALDASKFGPIEQGAWDAAVAGIRQQAFDHCKKGELPACLEELDTARRYDPKGEDDPTVRLARTEAEHSLQGTSSQLPLDPDSKVVPRRR